MKYNKKIVSILLTLFMIGSLQSTIFADNKTLVLTGNLYHMKNGEYVLSIEDISALRALDGKNLGFKIKTDKKSDSESSSEEVTQILGVRCVTEGRNSSTIYNAIQKMLVPSQDNKVLTLKYGASGSEGSTSSLENLLSGALSHKTENVIVEYFDNRVDGDSTVTAKVMYKIGKTSSSSSSSDSSFVVSEPTKNDQTTSLTKSSGQQKEKKIEYSKILESLKKEDKVYVKLSENSNTQIPKKLLSELKWNKYNNKEMIFEKYNKDNLLYRWIIPVNDVHYDEKFDIEIKTSDSSVEEVLKDKISHYKIISFTEKNSLPATVTVEIPMDFSEFDGSKLKILSVNLDKKEIEKKVMNFEIKDGKFIMKTGFGGNYIITDQDN